MITEVKHNPVPLFQPLIQLTRSLFMKVERVWSIVKEFIIKDFGACLRHIWYRVVFWINPHKYGINPSKVECIKRANQTAKVLLVLPGAKAHPSCYLPLAKKLYEEGVRNVYTVSLKQSDSDPVPIASLASRIQEITDKFLKSGYANVEYALVGHSLGALVGTKHIWRGKHQVENSKVSLMISVGGRLKYIKNKFSWFCEDVKPEIEKTFDAFSQDPNKVPLFTIWGDLDGLVPEPSAHIQGDSSKEFTVKGWAHNGVIFASATHKIITHLVKIWL